VWLLTKHSVIGRQLRTIKAQRQDSPGLGLSASSGLLMVADDGSGWVAGSGRTTVSKNPMVADCRLASH
jgi:hypothetical protein